MCISKVNPIKSRKKENKDTTKPVSIERLSPPIPTKSPKEVKKISKYFKVLNPSQAKNSLGNCMLRHLSLATTLQKFSRLKMLSPLSRQTKLGTYRKSLIVVVSLNHILT